MPSLPPPTSCAGAPALNSRTSVMACRRSASRFAIHAGAQTEPSHRRRLVVPTAASPLSSGSNICATEPPGTLSRDDEQSFPRAEWNGGASLREPPAFHRVAKIPPRPRPFAPVMHSQPDRYRQKLSASNTGSPPSAAPHRAHDARIFPRGAAAARPWTGVGVTCLTAWATAGRPHRP